MTIIIEKLTFAYERTSVLTSVSATAENGRITALIGPNASGKSTLLRCIIGALRPQSGSILIDDQHAHQLNGGSLARSIAYVPQRSTVSAAFTVREVVELGRYALPRDHHRVDDALERLELAEIARRPYQALSVGQQQRVTLARAIAQLSPHGHLILDEPTSAMDLRHISRCFTLLHELAGMGHVVVLALHDLAAAAMLADDVWLLDRGRVAASGSVAEVMEVERLARVFGVPFQWIEDGEGGRFLHPRVRGVNC